MPEDTTAATRLDQWLKTTTALLKVIADKALMTAMVLAAAGFAVPAATFLKRDRQPQTVEQRIAALSDSLKAASGAISDIEREVNARRELVTGLQRDADTARKLSAVNQEQVEAIAQVLRREVSADESKNFWISVAQNIFSAFLGFGLSEGCLWWRERRA